MLNLMIFYSFNDSMIWLFKDKRWNHLEENIFAIRFSFSLFSVAEKKLKADIMVCTL